MYPQNPHCLHCGQPLASDWRFCENCGARTAGPPAAAAARTATPARQPSPAAPPGQRNRWLLIGACGCCLILLCIVAVVVAGLVLYADELGISALQINLSALATLRALLLGNLL